MTNKQTVLRELYLDGELKSKTSENRVVYVRKNGTRFIRTMNNIREVEQVGDELIYKMYVKSFKLSSASEISMRLIQKKTKEGT